MSETLKTNKEIWNLMKVTDPRFTKEVTFGRGFTSIDPMYQIGKMTEIFGPVGHGWGYNVQYHYADTYIAAEVKVWTHDKKHCYGPVCSMLPLVNSKGKFDDEAGKKVMTDALTKAFSHLGMSADVFMGLFENSKYVEQVKKDLGIGTDKVKKIS
jgi:hypothetical protein